jgi:hypothetical protein
MKLTAGPHSDETKSLTTGHAAHIHAASPAGPRYDPNQTPAQRKAITNGIWLCRECGDIVDKDASAHTPELLRQWKADHEAMISEVRTKGYEQSIALLQANRVEPVIAKKIVASFGDHRALWQRFDAEFPDRVRRSLDRLRAHLTELRGELNDDGPLDQILYSLIKTIHIFFDAVETTDLDTLRCDSGDPAWCHFSDALWILRKSIGLQIFNLAKAYGLRMGAELRSIVPDETS